MGSKRLSYRGIKNFLRRKHTPFLEAKDRPVLKKALEPFMSGGVSKGEIKRATRKLASDTTDSVSKQEAMRLRKVFDDMTRPVPRKPMDSSSRQGRLDALKNSDRFVSKRSSPRDLRSSRGRLSSDSDSRPSPRAPL